MDSYLDIRVRRNNAFNTSEILSTVFLKLHIRLVAAKSTGIGVSFPEFSSENLGRVVRLHGNGSELGELMQTNWLHAARANVEISDVAAVPSGSNYRVVTRVQSKSSPERLRRRAIKREGISQGEARQRIPDIEAKLLHLPYVEMRSLSSNKKFRFFCQSWRVARITI